MNQDRSTTITNSQLKKGYKQTEVGIIPDDWEIVALGEILSFQNGVNADKKAYGMGIPFINVLEVITHPRLTVDLIPGKVSLTSQVIKTFKVGSGDILFNRTSETQEEVGLASVYLDKVDVVFGGFVIRGKLNKDFLDPIFCSYILRFPNIHSQISSRGQGAVRANIGQKELSKVKVCVPSKPEQDEIACTLSDIDALIESLDRLLTKKRQIKQGAMQELLRSKDGWIERQLGDISYIQTGSRNNQDKVEDGEYPLFVRSATVERINTYSYDCEAILIPGEGGIGSIFHYINGRFDAHQRVYVIRQFSEEISGKYVYLYMSKKFGFHAMQNSVKATVDSLRLPTFQNFQIFVPPTLEEQIEIANILSDMDAEIGSIESKLTKTRQLKQGMMHELLTGRIRLVD